MRTLTTAGQTAIDTAFAGEPVRWIEIQWTANGKSRHADKTIPNWATGTILKLSSIDQTTTQRGNLVNHEFSVTLDDSDGNLKNYMDTNDIHKKTCILYQWFSGLAITDSFELFRGQIYGPIVWSEGARTVSFTVVTPIYGREVGFSLEEGQFTFVPEKLTGKAWPVCFGSVLHVPCAVGADVATGVVGTMFGMPDPSLPYKQSYMEIQMQNLLHAYGVYSKLEQDCHRATLDYEIVEQTITFGSRTDTQAYTFVIATSGVLSGIGNSASNVDFVPFFDKATDYAVTTETILAKKPGKKVDPTTLVISQTKKPNSQSVATVTIANWPYPITIDSFLPAVGVPPVTSNVTKIRLADGTVRTNAQVLEAILKRPNELRTQYIDLIVEEDGLKQELEDLADQLEGTQTLSEQLKEAYASSGDPDLLAQLLAVETTRDANSRLTFEKKQELYRTAYDKAIAEIDLENLVSIFDVIGKVRAKQREIVKEYGQLHKQYAKLLAIIVQQRNMLGATTTIIDSEQFPQGTNTVTVNNVNLEGTLTGSGFAATTIVAQHTGIKIDPSKTPDIDTFWLLDPDMDLKGMYCRLPNNRLFKVTDQHGRQCKFVPVLLRDSTRNRSKEIIVNTANEPAIKKGLGDLLSGNETSAQLSYLANTFPSDISNDAKSRLTAAGTQQTISLFSDVPITENKGLDAFNIYAIPGEGIKNQSTVNGTPTGNIPLTAGTYTLVYGLQETKTLKITDSAATVKMALVRDTSLKSTDIDVTGGPLIDPSTGKYTQLTVDFVGLTLPKVQLKIGRRALHYNPPAGWENAKHVVDIYTRYTNATGAQEYTTNQRESKLKEVYDSTIYGDKLSKLQSSMKQLQAAINGADSAADVVAYRDAFNVNQAGFEQIISNIQLPQSVHDEVYRKISQKEYSNIFQMELLQWLYTRRYIDGIGNNVPDPREAYYFTGYDITYISEAAGIVPASWLNYLKTLNSEQFMEEMDILPEMQAYQANVGDVVKKAGAYQVTLIANILPSTIKAVYAYKTVDNYKRLVPVPTDYYTKNESYPYGTYLGVALNLTTLSLRKPLSEYPDEDWEDTVYVSLTSSVGPNPIDVIQYIAENYTTLTIDSTSFTGVRAVVADYPTHFCLLQKMDSLKLIEEIAFQSRCAVWVANGKLYINYLPIMGSVVRTITRADILLDSFEVSLTDTDNLVTKSKNTYVTTYAQESPYTLVLRGNLARYGEQVEEYNYFCLTNRGLVNKTATYWLIQKSNSWKKVQFRSTLKLLTLEPFDTVTLDLGSRTYVSSAPVNCRVESVSYDSDSNEVSVVLWAPVRAGEMTAYLFAWPGGLSTSDIFPLKQDAIAGNGGSGLGSSVPTGIVYDPYDSSLLAFRPDDYGNLKPGDVNDLSINDPTSNLVEYAEQLGTIEDFQFRIRTMEVERFRDVNMNGVSDTTEKKIQELAAEADRRANLRWPGKIKSFKGTEQIEVTTTVNNVPTVIPVKYYVYNILQTDGSTVTAYDASTEAGPNRTYLPNLPCQLFYFGATNRLAFLQD